MPPRSEWPHTPGEAVLATIIPWDGGLGVSYSYPDGAAEAHAIGPQDWSVIHVLERQGKVSFASEKVRGSFVKLRMLGFDY